MFLKLEISDLRFWIIGMVFLEHWVWRTKYHVKALFVLTKNHFFLLRSFVCHSLHLFFSWFVCSFLSSFFHWFHTDHFFLLAKHEAERIDPALLFDYSKFCSWCNGSSRRQSLSDVQSSTEVMTSSLSFALIRKLKGGIESFAVYSWGLKRLNSHNQTRFSLWNNKAWLEQFSDSVQWRLYCNML